MLLKKPLAQNLAELSHITEVEFSLSSWTGAVNMVFVEDSLLLIKRSLDMPTHRGQVGFLGGHRQADEICPKTTAFRELVEESSLDLEDFEFIGLETPVRTTNNSVLIPVVSRCCLSRGELVKRIKSNGEWSHFILANTQSLKQYSHWQYAKIYRESSFDVLFCALKTSFCEYFPPARDQEHYILWGATAKMIWNFFKKNS